MIPSLPSTRASAASMSEILLGAISSDQTAHRGRAEDVAEDGRVDERRGMAAPLLAAGTPGLSG